jgi:organic radical activating enzyme
LAFSGFDTRAKSVCCWAKFNTKFNSYSEAMNSPEAVKLQQELLNGIQNPICQPCWDQERIGIKSMRCSDITGPPDERKLKHLVIDSGNVCNLACRTCGPYSSSSHIKEYEAKYNKKFNVPIKKTNLEFLRNEDFSNLEQISVLGGEPFQNLDHLEILELIKELNDYATSYYIIFDDYDNYNIDDHDFFKLLIINDKLESSSFYPYVLKLSMDKEKNRKNVNLLSEYLIKNSVVKRSNKNFNKECYSLIHGGEFQLDNILKTDEFSKTNFKNGLRSIKSNKVGALLLSLVELERRKGLKTDFKTFNLDLSLEHIMPQSWSEKWSTERTPVVDENNKIVNDQEKARSIRNEIIYSIGNMTLLNKPLNSSLKNNDFATKVNGDGKKLMGYKDLSDLLITKIDIVNEVFVYGSKSWNENQIRLREDKIFKELYVKFYY